MLNRMILGVVAFTISNAAVAAKDEAKKEECPSFDLNAIESLLRQTPSCQRAVALFKVCEFGSSGDVSLGAAVTQKCKADFLSKLSVVQKRAYDREQQRCARKYQNKAGTMHRSFEAFCGAYVARDYSAKFLKADPGGPK